jgi:hypothetical protein
MKKAINADQYIAVRVQKAQTRFTRIKNPKGADTGTGLFFMIVDITAHTEAVFVPLTIASGKKVTGFIYQVEGTATGALSTTDIAVRGEGVTQVVLGTLLYSKIPKGSTASFRIQVAIKGKVGKEYSVFIHQINYKLNPADARYKKYTGGVRTPVLKFK